MSASEQPAMLKFILAARRKRTDTQARYFYEWGNIHVALMLTTPIVFTLFQRYTQHFAVPDITNTDVPLPLSPMAWDNMADHWLATEHDLLLALKHEQYVTRMQPHKFGDDAFQVVLMTGNLLHQAPDFASGGGVKLLLWAAPPTGQDPAAAIAAWRAEVQAPLLAANRALIRKYVHNTPHPVDPTLFQGTLFARGDVNAFAALDELWFDTLDDLRQLRAPAAITTTTDPARSFSMVTTERVVYDAATPAERTPPPAVHNPASLEARIAAQGFADWNIPLPARRTAAAI